MRLIQVVFSDAAYGFLWRKNGYAFFWLGKISFIMGKNTQKAMQHWRNAAKYHMACQAILPLDLKVTLRCRKKLTTWERISGMNVARKYATPPWVR